MRPLVIDKEAKTKIADVISYAMDHIFSLEDVKSLMSGGASPSGDNPGFVCTLYKDFRIVFSFEMQSIGVCRHMSVSIPPKDKYPNPATIEALMEEFGFTGKLEDATAVWREEAVGAVNVLQVVS